MVESLQGSLTAVAFGKDSIRIMTRHVAVITGSRAEWGLLAPLCSKMQTLGLRLSVLVTGSHLHAVGGNSDDEVRAAGFPVVEVPIIPAGSDTDDQKRMLQTIGNAFPALASALNRLNPDLCIVLGDRYEIFAAAAVCRLAGVRLAHISGGELTVAAFDDCLRHCITKLSDLHFAATEEYRRRIIQLGEKPDLVFNVGDLGLADLKKTAFKSRSELEAMLTADLKDFFLVTVHPETCNPGEGLRIAQLLTKLLATGFSGCNLIFTGANADPEGEKINDCFSSFAAGRTGAVFVRSLGRLNYLSAARLASCVIGNSSSGIVEVPALGTPVVNIGRRQTGRPHGDAVISIAAEEHAMSAALVRACEPDFRQKAATAVNPYEGEDSASRIASIIAGFDLASISREKTFFDLPRSL